MATSVALQYTEVRDHACVTTRHPSCIMRGAAAFLLLCGTFHWQPQVRVAAVTIRVGSLLAGERDMAARAAVTLVNSDPELLPEITLELVSDDPMAATDRFTALMSTETLINAGVVGLIGPHYSSVAHVMAPLAAGFGLPLISPSATDPTLSNTEQYPTFVRTVPPDDLQGRAIFELIQSFGWDRIAILHGADAYGRNGIRLLSDLCTGNGVKIIDTVEVRDDLQGINETMEDLHERNANIFVAHMHFPQFAGMITAADRHNLVHNKAWLATDSVSTRISQLPAAAQGILATTPHVSDSPQRAQLDAALPNGITDGYSPNSADAVRLFAHALHNLFIENSAQAVALATNATANITMRLAAQARLLAHISSVHFTGASGTLELNAKLDRTGDPGFNIVNVQVNNTPVHVGRWTENHNQPILSAPQLLRWPGGGDWSNIPRTDGLSEPLAIAVFEFSPFFSCRCGKCSECAAEDTSPDKYEGIVPDIVESLASRIDGFTYTFHIWKDSPNMNISTYYSSTADGCQSGWSFSSERSECSKRWYNVSGKEPLTYSYTSFVKAVGRGDYDIGAADITVTSDRAMFGDFSTSFMSSGIGMVRRVDALRPIQPTADTWLFLQPFTLEFWLLELPLLVVGVGFGFSILQLFSVGQFDVYAASTDVNQINSDASNASCTHSNEDARTKSPHGTLFRRWIDTMFGPQGGMWQAVEAVFAMNDTSSLPHGTRMFTWTWNFAMLVIVASYTANITTFLVQNPIINACKDLSCMGKSVGKIATNAGSTSTHSFLATYIPMQIDLLTTSGTKAAIAAVSNDEAAAAVGDSWYLEYQVRHNADFKCELVFTGDIVNKQDQAFVFRRNLFVGHLIDAAFLDMKMLREVGTRESQMDEILNSHIAGPGTCQIDMSKIEKEIANPTPQLSYHHFSGIMYLLAAVFAVVLLVQDILPRCYLMLAVNHTHFHTDARPDNDQTPWLTSVCYAILKQNDAKRRPRLPNPTNGGDNPAQDSRDQGMVNIANPIH